MLSGVFEASPANLNAESKHPYPCPTAQAPRPEMVIGIPPLRVPLRCAPATAPVGMTGHPSHGNQFFGSLFNSLFCPLFRRQEPPATSWK